jgi:hypothetical protein
MTWIQLKKPPENLSDFVGAPDYDTPEKSEQNLRGLIKQGTSNIKAVCFDVGIINNLEKEIIENGYRVQFVPTIKECFADFYLAKF